MATKEQPSKTGVTRRDFLALVQAVEECSKRLDLQFTRIAQIQAELDHIRAAWRKAR